jgi:pimeloyl-ACP methyl ester carboxylesterase
VSVPAAQSGAAPTRAGPRVPVRRAYADGRFGQVHYRIAGPSAEATGDGGQRRPLLCLHMSPNSGRIYQRFLAAMGTDRIAIAPDTPGFGESDPPSAAPSIEDYAAAMGDLVDALGVGEFDVMGYHTGSETSVALALARPRQVRRIVMVSAPIFTAEELVEFRRHYRGVALDPEGSHLVRKWKGQLHWAMPGKTIDMVAEDFVDCVRNPAISWWGHYAAFAYDVAANLPRVDQPVLVLNPDDDLHAHTLRDEGLLRNGHMVHLAGWGHGFLDVHTDAARAIVTEFLDGPAP